MILIRILSQKVLRSVLYQYLFKCEIHGEIIHQMHIVFKYDAIFDTLSHVIIYSVVLAHTQKLVKPEFHKRTL